MTKSAIELKTYCKIKNCNNIDSKDKKLNGKTKKCWFGINQCNDDIESDDDTIQNF